MRPYGILLVAFILFVGILYGFSCFIGSIACSAMEKPDASKVRSQVVSVEEFRDIISGNAVLLDVRTPAEYAAGHISGAQLIDWEDPSFSNKVAVLSKTTPYAIYCRSGNRSRAAREAMIAMGFTDVRDLSGGINAWRNAGYPVE